jgi:glycosyltransferase involved in cell wall biosynthesis
MNLSVSIVIPAFNCASTIDKTLTAIQRQTHPGPLETIVVDDGSTDQTAAVVKSYPNVRYIYQPNAGPASARNRGAARASHTCIFFTDADCIPHPDWVEKTLQGFHAPAIGAVAGSYGIANPDNRLARCVYAEIRFRHDTLLPAYPKAFGSYNVAIRKELFMEVGGFNETYTHASGEDNDLSYKILKTGHTIFFERRSRVDHHHPTSLRKYLREQFRHGFWRARMYRDHPQMMRGDDYTFWKDICEMPLVLGVSVFALLTLFRIPFSAPVFIFSACALFVLEIFFSWRTAVPVKEKFFLAFVWGARAFFRFFGFSTGILQILRKQKGK